MSSCCSGKKQYDTEGAALAAGDEVNEYRKSESSRQIAFTAYQCDDCDEWHLTSRA